MTIVEPNWLRKLIASLEKRKAETQKTYEICKEAREKELSPREYWLQEKEKAEKNLEEISRSLKLWKDFLKKHSD